MTVKIVRTGFVIVSDHLRGNDDWLIDRYEINTFSKTVKGAWDCFFKLYPTMEKNALSPVRVKMNNDGELSLEISTRGNQKPEFGYIVCPTEFMDDIRWLHDYDNEFLMTHFATTKEGALAKYIEVGNEAVVNLEMDKITTVYVKITEFGDFIELQDPNIPVIEGFVICPDEQSIKDGWLEDFPIEKSFAPTVDEAWQKFCHPALKREGYENDGFQAIKATIQGDKFILDSPFEPTIEPTIEPPKMSNTVLSRTVFLHGDLETGGLDGLLSCGNLGAAYYPIFEIAVIVTNNDLKQLGEPLRIVIHQSETEIAKSHEWAIKQHTKSGLLDEVRASKISLEQAEQMVINHLKDLGINKYDRKKRTGAIFSGNSIKFDRNFMNNQMPNLDEYLHYRQLDISVLALAARAFYPELEKSISSKKKYTHLALDDIRESIAELKAYKRVLFK